MLFRSITGDGFCSTNFEVADWEGAFVVEKAMWKDTIREALDYYLDIYLEEE